MAPVKAQKRADLTLESNYGEAISSRSTNNQKKAKKKKRNEKDQHPPSISFNKYGVLFTSWLSLLWMTLSRFVAALLRRRRIKQVSAKVTENENDINNNSDIGNRHLCIVGLDCEMVGVGYKGRNNMLARCTLVLWDPDNNSSDEQQQHPSIKVIYDKLVKPTQRVVDYRTEYSGITREMLHEQQHQPLVDFQTCRAEVRSLLSSIGGKNVLLVGHGEIKKSGLIAA
jgi:hypothetical protein